MVEEPAATDVVDQRVNQLFALVSEALARATHALLHADAEVARGVVADDRIVDDLTAEVETLIWERLEAGPVDPVLLRHLVGVLLILPELERSADLAEHVAQRALARLGSEMSPLSRGIVQRMTEVALEMWRAAADAYAERSSASDALAEADEELDILHERLTSEVATEAMPVSVAAQVTLLARFYERLGDHAVNLARRIESLPERRLTH
ncbi:MAG: phosphate signaling complex PhoU family protein [Acidimicrobiales bacterium]